MKKICVFTLYADKGASSQYRTYVFKEMLEKYYHVQWYYFWDNVYVTQYMHNKKGNYLKIGLKYLAATMKRWWELVFVAPNSDVIILQKAVIPKQKRHFLNKAKKKGVKIVFDVDDAVYLDKKDNSNKIAEMADVVICGNDNLKNHYLKYCKNTIVLPTIDNTFKYEHYWNDTFPIKSIGWIGSKATIDNLELVVDPINHIIERHPEVQFYIISNDALDYTKKIKNSHLIIWNKDKYLKDLSKITIGLMPLKDTEYNRGKCGFKLIQYLNMKKPVVGSNVGVNKSIIAGNGYGADTAEEWEEALEKLLFNKECYQTCLRHIENDFLKKYHYSVICNKLLRILESV